MNDKNKGASQNRIAQRKEHGNQLRSEEKALQESAADRNQQQFFGQITPLLGSLKGYIARRLRIAYLNLDLRADSVYREDDILDETVLTAYQNFDKKPKDLSLEQWLYRLANQKVENYLKRSSPRDPKRRSLEELTQKEERTLKERITADAEGQPMLVEDLYDNEYHLQPEFTPPRLPERSFGTRRKKGRGARDHAGAYANPGKRAHAIRIICNRGLLKRRSGENCRSSSRRSREDRKESAFSSSTATQRLCAKARILT